eukprot:11198699-Lingulodinium_polyedra.AAC.1
MRGATKTKTWPGGPAVSRGSERSRAPAATAPPRSVEPLSASPSEAPNPGEPSAPKQAWQPHRARACPCPAGPGGPRAS